MIGAPAAQVRPRFRLPRFDVIWASILFVLVLMGGSWYFVLELDRRQAHPFFSMETLGRASSFLHDLFGIGATAPPAFAQAGEWLSTGHLAYDTLVMSVVAIGFAGIGVLFTFMMAARNVMLGGLERQTSWSIRRPGAFVSPFLFFLIRAVYTFTRAIPELIWAMLVIFVFSPGIVPGAVALGVHNVGVFGKLAAEVVEGLDMRSARALQSSGASRAQVLLYGILPQALPRFLTYLFYRWEVIIRTTIVVGFVAAGGLGMAFRLGMSEFHYTTVALLLMWYLILVAFVDLTAAGMRRLAR